MTCLFTFMDSYRRSIVSRRTGKLWHPSPTIVSPERCGSLSTARHTLLLLAAERIDYSLGHFFIHRLDVGMLGDLAGNERGADDLAIYQDSQPLIH